MFLIPLRVEGARVDRLPVVSIGIAVLCALAFLVTWVLPRSTALVDSGELQEAIEYFEEHPYLELSPQFCRTFLGASAVQQVSELHQAAADQKVIGGEPQRVKEQAWLDDLARRLIEGGGSSLIRRFSLVPARGLFQLGWLTHMFLHFGWMHLLGNMLFFYLTGPLLEDAWGRRFFLGFYLVGGLAAAAAYASLEHGSGVSMAGASGAIAACMGAFSFRFANRKIRMGYLFFLFFRIFRGTFLLPAWLWALAWFGTEVFSFGTGSAGGVAVMAHIGGFLFGACVALMLSLFGLEAAWLRPAFEGATAFRQREAQPDDIDQARAALNKNDLAAAARAYRNVLVARPGDREALVGLAKVELLQGDAARAMARLDKLALEQLQAGQPEEAFRALMQAGAHSKLGLLSPQVTRMLWDARGRAPAGTAAIAVGLTVARGSAPGSKPAAQPASLSSAPRIIASRLQALDDISITVEALTGEQRIIPLSRLAGVGAALLQLDGAALPLVFTDLVLRMPSAAGPATAVRIAGPQLGLAALFPGLPPKEGYRRLLARLLDIPGIVALPDRAALENGQLPRFTDNVKLDAAFYPPA